MTKAEFQFNLKFNLHKSVIPIGIEDDDYERLSVAYGVSLEELMEEVNADKASNAEEAKRLLQEFPDAAERLRNKKFAFLGDSISSDRRSFCNVIQTAFRDQKDISFLDGSVSAFKATDIVTNLYPTVPDFHADITHVMIGSNDCKRTTDEAHILYCSLEEYNIQLHYLVSKLLEGGSKVILSTIPPFCAERIKVKFDSVNVTYDESDREDFNRVVRREAQRLGCVLNEMEPVYAEYDIRDLTLEDGLHLNVLGQRLLMRGVMEKMLLLAK